MSSKHEMLAAHSLLMGIFIYQIFEWIDIYYPILKIRFISTVQSLFTIYSIKLKTRYNNSYKYTNHSCDFSFSNTLFQTKIAKYCYINITTGFQNWSH